jgi:heme-degrading monooxygenase HmoA
MMISRHWSGIAKPGEADNYVDHLKNDTFPKLMRIRGFNSASILTRRVDQGTEFLIVTVWEAEPAIHADSADEPRASGGTSRLICVFKTA